MKDDLKWFNVNFNGLRSYEQWVKLAQNWIVIQIQYEIKNSKIKTRKLIGDRGK